MTLSSGDVLVVMMPIAFADDANGTGDEDRSGAVAMSLLSCGRHCDGAADAHTIEDSHR